MPPPPPATGEPAVFASDGHGILQDLLLRGLGGVDLRGKFALPHHQDAVAEHNDFGQFRRDPGLPSGPPAPSRAIVA